jgi:hypothetical protein
LVWTIVLLTAVVIFGVMLVRSVQRFTPALEKMEVNGPQ